MDQDLDGEEDGDILEDIQEPEQVTPIMVILEFLTTVLVTVIQDMDTVTLTDQ